MLVAWSLSILRILKYFFSCSITPALLREASYTTIRLGMYEPAKVFLGATDPAHTPLWKKVVAGALSGTVGATIANPTDLIKIRFMGAGLTLPYKNTWHAFKSIVEQEGVLGLWTGVRPTVKRAALVTATQISSYDHTKHLVLNAGLMDEGPLLHIASSIVAGCVTNIVASPVDIVRTRIMTQKNEKGAVLMYKGTADCILKTVKSEGILGLYKGFVPNWTRTGLHTITIFFVFEQLRRLVGMKPM